MATKKECDRCEKQWKPEYDEYRERDPELCTLNMSLPDNSRHKYNEHEKSVTLELCQFCAREILKFIQKSKVEKE